MAFNRIQFQHGMSIPGFRGRASTEAPCAETVRRTPAFVARPADSGDERPDRPMHLKLNRVSAGLGRFAAVGDARG